MIQLCIDHQTMEWSRGGSGAADQVMANAPVKLDASPRSAWRAECMQPSYALGQANRPHAYRDTK